MNRDKFINSLERIQSNLNEAILDLNKMEFSERKELLQRIFKIDREIHDLKVEYLKKETA